MPRWDTYGKPFYYSNELEGRLILRYPPTAPLLPGNEVADLTSASKVCVIMDLVVNENMHYMPVFCLASWAEWGTWTQCSVSCGKGVRYRIRLCDDPDPDTVSAVCEGSNTGSQFEEETCIKINCPESRWSLRAFFNSCSIFIFSLGYKNIYVLLGWWLLLYTKWLPWYK